jgi:hypothetical protein
LLRCFCTRSVKQGTGLSLVAQMASRGIEVVSVQQFLDILSGSADG